MVETKIEDIDFHIVLTTSYLHVYIWEYYFLRVNLLSEFSVGAQDVSVTDGFNFSSL